MEETDRRNISCKFWDFNIGYDMGGGGTASSNCFVLLSTNLHQCREDGGWSDAGVTTVSIFNTTVLCSSEHLTSFAVLLDHQNVLNNDNQGTALSVVGYIGSTVSLVSLIITLVFLIVLRWGDEQILHWFSSAQFSCQSHYFQKEAESRSTPLCSPKLCYSSGSCSAGVGYWARDCHTSESEQCFLYTSVLSLILLPSFPSLVAVRCGGWTAALSVPVRLLLDAGWVYHVVPAGGEGVQYCCWQVVPFHAFGMGWVMNVTRIAILVPPPSTLLLFCMQVSQ